ncbi:NUDIX hydrolase [Actinomadura scrupuli]|uniref:NUDIX hydrolase n=1 Tax=Actinomadura scrupuli TaxID=559629 RepID=UPI003D95E392
MIRAAGTVLWRPGDEGPEVALIHRPRKKDWSFPKGKLRSGESVREAAVRETREETGMTPAFGSPLPPRRYVKGWRLKRVDYWAATVTGPATFVPNHEVDRLEWLSLPAARRRLTHARDRRLLDAFATAAPEIR